MRITNETKTGKLVNLLRRRIIDASLSEADVGISELRLSQEYGVGRSTVREALSILKNDGLIIQSPGRRTTANCEQASRRVAFVLREDEHTNFFITTPLLKAMTALGWQMSLLHPEALGTLLRQPPDLIVLYEDVFFESAPCRRTLDLLKGFYPNAKIVGVLLGDCASDFAACCVRLDMGAPNEALTRHLLQLGHCRFLHITATGFMPHGPPNPIPQGIRRAVETCAEASLQVIDAQADIHRWLLEHFSSKSHATAVIASYDFLANTAIHTLNSLGINVPGDVSVSGQFNTPWSEQTTPPLTSTRIGQLAFQEAFRMVAQEGLKESVVAMELVLRGSTGARRLESSREG